MTKKIVIIFIILAALVLSVCAFVWFKDGAQKPASTEQPISATNTDVVKPENTATTTSDLKTYRNDEWGFEFQYPGDLVVNENMFGSYYSKFNLVLFKMMGESHDWAVVVNVVTPEFVNTSFWKSQENSSKVVVDGVEGTKYEYEYEGFPQVAVVLPFGEYKIILGTGDGSKPYTEELNQILSSFKFLKK